VELYPAESRLMDTSNKYHLWAITDPTFRFPFGSASRHVHDEDRLSGAPTLRQRKYGEAAGLFAHEELTPPAG
jgi:hypothetical protein